MDRHELIAALHQSLEPRSYLEIGVNHGVSLALSRTRTIGIDPAFTVDVDIACDVQLARATSDDFFARPDPISWFPERVIDFALIDGLHVFEFALRDFMNVEAHSSPATVVVFDDMLPRTSVEAARDRLTISWAGDVYKVATVLERYRPDLVLVPVDTSPTGVVVVAGLDASSTVLKDHYDEIMAEFATPDPQVVPDDLLHRRTAADPDQLVAVGTWADIVAARSAGTDPDVAPLRQLRGTAAFVLAPPPTQPWPTKKLKQRMEREARAAARAAGTPLPPKTPDPAKEAARAARIAARKEAAAQKAAANKAAKKTAAKKAARPPKPPPGLVMRIRKAIKRRL